MTRSTVRAMPPEHPVDDQPPHGDPLREPAGAPPAPADEGPSIRPEPDDGETPHGDPLRDDERPAAG
jgi:hypothetical protein